MTTDTETSPKIDCPKDNKHNESNEKSKDEYKSKNKENESNNKKSRRRSRTRSRTRSRSRSRSRDKKRHKRYYKDDDYPESYPRYYGDDSDDKRNNDKYWNKYPKRDEIVIGKRYYGESDKNKKHKDDQHKSNESGDSKSKEKKPIDLMTKTGGAYIPPAKLRLMQAEITDKKSVAYQRIAWEALKKSIHGYINKVNTSNIGIISKEILHENIVRGRGLLCKSIIQAQAASPTFTNVYAALVAVINSKFPNIGELLLKRLVLQFKRGFKQNNKSICISATTFVAHLVNQRVAHEILALEILTLLVESPTDDSVEVAISFLKECGQKLTEVSSKGINAIFEMLRNILHEGKLEQRIQYMIEVMFQIRKDGFKDHAAVIEELDLVEEEDQFTHLISLDDVKQDNAEEILNVFKFDENYEENEGKYVSLRKEILDSSGDSESSSGSENEKNSDEDDDDDDDDDNEDIEQQKENTIIDNTETNLVALRRTIYLTIQSSLDFEECAHKLMKMELKPGQEIELCHMFLDCCAEQRTYEKFYGLLAQRFCQVNNIYVEPFQQIFKDTYATTHRLDTGKLRNVGKFFAHLLFTDAISWEVLSIMKLNEEDTNSSNRIFIKVLFQELAEYMGLEKLNVRLKDGTLQEHFVGLFPKDNPKNTRFSINFFTSIGLGGLTAELRDHLKTVPKTLPQIITTNTNDDDTSNSSSSNSSSSSSSSSSGSSSNSSSDSSDSSSSNSSSSEDSSNSSSDESSEDDKKRKKKIEKQKQIKNNKSKEKKKLSEKKRDNRNDKENLKDLRKEEHNKYKQEHRNKLDYKNRDDYKRRNDYRSDNRDKYNRREKNDYKEKNNYKEKRNNYKDRCESNRNHRRGNSKDKSPH